MTSPRFALAPVTPRSRSVIEDAGGGAILAAEEFFLAGLRNRHTRRAYTRHVEDFLAWCGEHEIALAAVSPGHAAAWIDGKAASVSSQRIALAALRRFFALLVTRHAVLLNPFDSVRGPRREERREGKAALITPAQGPPPSPHHRLVPARPDSATAPFLAPWPGQEPVSARSRGSGSGTSGTSAITGRSASTRSGACPRDPRPGGPGRLDPRLPPPRGRRARPGRAAFPAPSAPHPALRGSSDAARDDPGDAQEEASRRRAPVHHHTPQLPGHGRHRPSHPGRPHRGRSVPRGATLTPAPRRSTTD